MVKPNNPYARPVNATKDSAVTVGEYYGKRVTDKSINHIAGGRNVSPASRYQAPGINRATATPKTKPRKSKPAPVVEAAVTAEDLFG